MNVKIEVLPDNPAARLMSILDEMVNIPFRSQEQISAVFARVFDIKNTPSEVFPHYSQMFVLIQEAHDKVIQYYPKQQKTHAQWQNDLSKTFRQHSPYHHEWAPLIASIKSGTNMDMIQVASDSLSHHVEPTEVQELNIADLETQIADLVADITSSEELSTYLKTFLKEELEKILDNIKHFDLYGSVPIKKSIYNIMSNHEILTKSSLKIIKDVATVAALVCGSIGFINNAAQFPNSLEYFKSQFIEPKIDAVHDYALKNSNVEIISVESNS